MTEQEMERLSALVDNELSPHDIAGEVRKLSQNEKARVRWSNYHLIGDAMRREIGPIYNTSLARSISQRLDEEPVILAPAALKSKASVRRKALTGVAVAASLAAVAMVMTPQLINQESSAPAPAVAQQPPAEARTYYVAQDGTRWELLKKPAVESRLNAYLVNHQERSPSSNIKGIMPYATFVSYDENKQ